MSLLLDTEIDWEAYMSEVNGWMHGDWNYGNLRGDTGPLVYPAGFVYIFTMFYQFVHPNIHLAQFIFAILYCIMLLSLFIIYKKSIVSWNPNTVFLLVLLCTSRRIHSIFMLRLFNDTIAMTFAYMAIVAFLYDNWSLGCLLYSVGLSVKMNVLLFLPGLLVLLVKRFGLIKTMLHYVSLIILPQLLLGAPFIYANWREYVKGSFDFGRKFFHVWTVNWKFLPEDFFRSDEFAQWLLFGQLISLVLFAAFKWCYYEGGIKFAAKALFLNETSPKLSGFHIVSVLFTSNFIGIVFARSLHFQFYVWYFHQLPFLLWTISVTRLPSFLANGLRLTSIIAIELIWNIFPSNYYTSMALTGIHFSLLLALFLSPFANPSIQ